MITLAQVLPFSGIELLGIANNSLYYLAGTGHKDLTKIDLPSGQISTVTTITAPGFVVPSTPSTHQMPTFIISNASAISFVGSGYWQSIELSSGYTNKVLGLDTSFQEGTASNTKVFASSSGNNFNSLIDINTLAATRFNPSWKDSHETIYSVAFSQPTNTFFCVAASNFNTSFRVVEFDNTNSLVAQRNFFDDGGGHSRLFSLTNGILLVTDSFTRKLDFNLNTIETLPSGGNTYGVIGIDPSSNMGFSSNLVCYGASGNDYEMSQIIPNYASYLFSSSDLILLNNQFMVITLTNPSTSNRSLFILFIGDRRNDIDTEVNAQDPVTFDISSRIILIKDNLSDSYVYGDFQALAGNYPITVQDGNYFEISLEGSNKADLRYFEA